MRRELGESPTLRSRLKTLRSTERCWENGKKYYREDRGETFKKGLPERGQIKKNNLLDLSTISPLEPLKRAGLVM